MKKVFLILVLISTFIVGCTQTISNRSSGAVTTQDARLSALYNLLIPRYSDTTQANLTQYVGLDSCGAVIFTRSDNNVWKRNCNVKKWELVGGAASVNIYNSNGSATGPRTYNGGGYPLTFNNISNLNLGSTGSTTLDVNGNSLLYGSPTSTNLSVGSQDLISANSTTSDYYAGGSVILSGNATGTYLSSQNIADLLQLKDDSLKVRTSNGINIYDQANDNYGNIQVQDYDFVYRNSQGGSFSVTNPSGNFTNKLTLMGADTTPTTLRYKFPKITSDRYLPISVNGNYADEWGNVTVSGGGADSSIFATQYRLDTVKANLRTSINLKQNQLSGTGFVKASGTTISYDNSTYLTTSSAASTYAPIASPTFTGTLTTPNITVNSLASGAVTDSIVTVVGATGLLKKRTVSDLLSSGSNWNTTGNSGLSNATNFIGTTDAGKSLHYKVAGVETHLDSSNGTSYFKYGLNIGGAPYNTYPISYCQGGWSTEQAPYYLSAAYSVNMAWGNNSNGWTFNNSTNGPFVWYQGNGTNERMRIGYNGSLCIGTTTELASSILTVGGTNKGILIPRMTTTQRDAISSPATALAVYNTTNNTFDYYNGTAWKKVGVSIMQDFIADVNNSGTSETDIFTYTTPASTLTATGEKLVADYSGTFNDITATAQLQVYFAGNNIGNTGALTVSATGAWNVKTLIIRTGSSTARSVVTVSTPGASTAAYTMQTDLTGITWTNTNIIKITGTSGGAGGGSSDITGKLGYIEYKPAVNN